MDATRCTDSKNLGTYVKPTGSMFLWGPPPQQPSMVFTVLSFFLHCHAQPHSRQMILTPNLFQGYSVEPYSMSTHYYIIISSKGVALLRMSKFVQSPSVPWKTESPCSSPLPLGIAREAFSDTPWQRSISTANRPMGIQRSSWYYFLVVWVLEKNISWRVGSSHWQSWRINLQKAWMDLVPKPSGVQ